MQEVNENGYENGKIKMALSGELDAGKVDEFYNVVMTAYQKTPAPIEFDCAELEFIDSTTLGTFVRISKEIKKGGHLLSLQKLQPKIKKLFLICALDSVMEIA